MQKYSTRFENEATTLGLSQLNRVEKTTQCHTPSSLFLFWHLMRKKKHSAQGPLQEMGEAVTLSEAASFLSAILKEGPELSCPTD